MKKKGSANKIKKRIINLVINFFLIILLLFLMGCNEEKTSLIPNNMMDIINASYGLEREYYGIHEFRIHYYTNAI